MIISLHSNPIPLSSTERDKRQGQSIKYNIQKTTASALLSVLNVKSGLQLHYMKGCKFQ